MAEEKVGFIERMVLQTMITKVMGIVNGYKTYLLAGLGIVVAVAGHFWGPFQLLGGTIPRESWSDVWQTVYASGIISALRHGISKAIPGGTK